MSFKNSLSKVWIFEKIKQYYLGQIKVKHTRILLKETPPAPFSGPRRILLPKKGKNLCYAYKIIKIV